MKERTLEIMFYDGTKLLSLKDIDGNDPEIYLCSNNRSAGKSTFFNRYLVNKFLKGHGKFALLYRFNYELDDCSDKFFKEIRNLFFQEHNMESKRRGAGIYHELFLDDISCGYAISINSADQIKKNSHLLADTERILFDEFQSESNHYCPNEIDKFISIHTSIARGGGKQVRRVPVYMLSNRVSLLNPYYVALGVSDKLREDTKFLRGKGFVLEQGLNESAIHAQEESLFNQAFSKSSYIKYASQGIYLNDNTAFVEKPVGKSRYLCTIKIENVEYAIRLFDELGIAYCDNAVDTSCKWRLCATTDDHAVNYIMLRTNNFLITELRYFFENGCFRFKNLDCKNAILKLLSY